MSVIPQSIAYKESGIPWLGKIPEHWEILPLQAVFQNRSENNSDKKIDLILSLVKDVGVIPYEEKGDVGNKSKDDLSQYKIARENDIVLNKMNAVIGSIGISKYVGLVSPIYLVFTIRNHKLYDPMYFYRMFEIKTLQESLSQYASGIMKIRESIDYLDFKKMHILVPPLQEQKAIADFLDKKTHQIKEFIAKKQKLIALLEEKKQTLINQCVTQGLDPSTPLKDSGVEWLGKIPTHWEVRKLKHLGKFQNGINIGAEAFGSGSPFVSYGDVYKNSSLPKTIQGLVKSSEIDQKLYSVKKGDIFFTRTSETIEEIGMSSVCFQTIPNATFAGFLIRFRPSGNELDKGFSKFYFRSNLHRIFFIRENGLVTRASLSQELLKDIPVLLPPLEEQKAIAEYLDTQIEKIDLAICKIKSQINLIKEYKSTLISEAVCGRAGIT